MVESLGYGHEPRRAATAPAPAATPPDAAPRVLVASIGKVLTDEVLLCVEEPLPDSHQSVSRRSTAGGAAANVAANLAAHGYPARLAGWAGADDTSRATLGSLSHPLIDDRVVRRGHGPVSTVLAWGGDRSFLVDQGTSRPEPGDVGEEWVSGAGVVHLNGYELLSYGWPAVLADIARLAHQVGAHVSVDCANARRLRAEGAATYLAALRALSADVLFTNASEAAVLGLDRATVASLMVAGDLPPLVVVHAGTSPTTVFQGGSELVVPVTDIVAEPETTGCGDAFAAGFLSVWAQDHSAVDDAVRTAHEWAAQIARVPGGQPSLG